MRPDFVLHIGANKTGSSAIQQFIADNVHILRLERFAIPDYRLEWGEEISGEQVLALQTLLEAKNASSAIERVFSDLAHTRPEGSTILLSGENLANLDNRSAFEAALKRFRTKVILYIRRQDDFLFSSWQQWESKINADFERWMVHAVQHLGHWENTIAIWEGIVGHENMKVRIYDRREFPDGGVVSDFVRALGLTSPWDAFVHRTVSANPSPSPIVTSLAAGNPRLFDGEHDNRFIDTMGQLVPVSEAGNRLSVMTRSQRAAVLIAYSAENERVRERYFPERPWLFRPLDLDHYVYLSETELMREQLRYLVEAVYALRR